MTSLGTSTDLFVEEYPRKAGVESGRFYSTWVEARFRIFENPAPVRTLTTGIAWEVSFHTLDEEIEAHFDGYAETRRLAKLAVSNTITKHVYTISELRKKFPFAKTEDALARTTQTTKEPSLVPFSVPEVVIEDRSWRWTLRVLVDRVLRWLRLRL